MTHLVHPRLAVILPLAMLACCSLQPGVEVSIQQPNMLPRSPKVGPLNAEAEFSRGHFLEVQKYLEDSPVDRDTDPRNLALHGKVLLARGDLDSAIFPIQRAIRLEARAKTRGQLEWDLAQGCILDNRFGLASEYAEDAVGSGQELSPGFLRFLKAVASLRPYTGVPEGETHSTALTMEDFDLLRVSVKVQETETMAVIDSGATYSILTESLARQAGVSPIEGSNAYGRGLHKKEIPLTFAVADRLEIAGFVIRDVPLMVMPDDALLFETSRGRLLVPMVLGLHLIKEFACEIDYGEKLLVLSRRNPSGAKRDPVQNLFFVRGRLLVQASVNLSGWYQFLLDTGSETTMLTSAGLRRAGLSPSNKFYPQRVQGIGRSQVEWGKVSRVAIGIDGFLLRFQDLVVRDDDEASEDGIVGASLLKNFKVRLDFRRMRLSLEPSGPARPARPG